MQDVNLLAQTLENVIPKAALKRGSEPLRDAWRKLAELDEQSPARAAYRADEKAWLLYFEMKRVTDAGSKYHVPDKAKYRAFLAELDTWEPKKIEDAFRRLVSENLSSELLQQLGDAIKRLKERTRSMHSLRGQPGHGSDISLVTEPTAVAPADAHVDAQVEPSRSTSTTPLPFDPIRASATTALPSEHPTLPTTPVTPANPTNSLSSASRTQSPARFVRPYTQRGVLNSQGTPPVTKILVETQEKPFLQNLHSPSWENLGQIFPRTFRDLLVPRTGAGYRGFSAGVVLGLSNPVFRKDLYDGQVQLEIKSGHLPMLVEKLFNLEMKTEGNLRSYVTQTGQSLELSESENAPIKYQRLRGCVFDAITDSMFGAEMATAIRGSEQFKEDRELGAIATQSVTLLIPPHPSSPGYLLLMVHINSWLKFRQILFPRSDYTCYSSPSTSLLLHLSTDEHYLQVSFGDTFAVRYLANINPSLVCGRVDLDEVYTMPVNTLIVSNDFNNVASHVVEEGCRLREVLGLK